MRAFLSPGERATLRELDEHRLPDDVRIPGRYETEGDVVRLLCETFDATLVDHEPPRAAQSDESEQLAMLGCPPSKPRRHWDG